jgi:hypothetical protein
MLAIPLNIPVFERGASGIPTTTLADDLTGRIESYEHTIAATIGFESMRCNLTTEEFAKVDVDEAVDMLSRWLGRSTVVTGPDAETVWEGFLTQIDADFGQGETRSIGLDAMANRINVRYTTVLGTPGSTGTASDTASQALYGVKDAVLSLPGTSTATAALNFRAKELARRKNPRMIPSTQIQRSKEDNAPVAPGTARISLTWAGWYTTLGWVLTSRTDTSTEATTTQVGALIGTSAPGIGATNAFLSTSTTLIVASGISDTRKIEADTTYRQKIEALLGQGNSAGERLAYMVLEDRKLTVRQWAGATPNTVTYRRDLGDPNVYDATYGLVEPWNVRPDAIYEVRDLLDIGPVTTAADAAARLYVERVVCSITPEGTNVALEPQASDSFDAMLARLG